MARGEAGRPCRSGAATSHTRRRGRILRPQGGRSRQHSAVKQELKAARRRHHQRGCKSGTPGRKSVAVCSADNDRAAAVAASFGARTRRSVAPPSKALRARTAVEGIWPRAKGYRVAPVRGSLPPCAIRNQVRVFPGPPRAPEIAGARASRAPGPRRFSPNGRSGTSGGCRCRPILPGRDGPIRKAADRSSHCPPEFRRADGATPGRTPLRQDSARRDRVRPARLRRPSFWCGCGARSGSITTLSEPSRPTWTGCGGSCASMGCAIRN